jgi:hypothetical protein
MPFARLWREYATRLTRSVTMINRENQIMQKLRVMAVAMTALICLSHNFISSSFFLYFF